MNATADHAQSAQSLVDLPLVSWRAAVDAMSTSDRQEIARAAEHAAARYAMLAEYIGGRIDFDGPDDGHEKAVRNANRAHSAMRKVLGYHSTPWISF